MTAQLMKVAVVDKFILISTKSFTPKLFIPRKLIKQVGMPWNCLLLDCYGHDNSKGADGDGMKMYS